MCAYHMWRILKRNATFVSHRSISSAIDSHLAWLVQAPSKLSNNSIKRLKLLQKPSVRLLIPELVKENELGFKTTSGIVSKGTLVDFVVEQKKLHPDKIILVRVGEFYETYGLDALLMIEYAGLNPMGNKARAGCPVKNIQQTLDQLTNAGLVVAVYEEINIGKDHLDLKKGKIKHRILSQVVSQASPTYTYDLKLSDSLDFRESRPIIGITLEFGGYNLCQIYVDEKVVFVRDKLPIEALKTILSSSGFLEPVYVSPSVKGIVSSELGIEVEMVSSENIEQSESAAFYAAVLRRVARELSLAVEGFREINHSLHELSDSVRTQPLNLFTAQEIGVLPNLNVPSLVSYLLPPSSSASSRKYLKQLLVVPPPHKLAQNFRSILLALSTTANLVTLPKMTPLGIGKIVNLLSTSRCNVASFREIAQNICGVIKLLEINSDIGTMITSNLLQLVEYDSGVVINRSEFYSKLITIDSLISRAITPCTQLKEYKYSQVPHEFFRRNETDFSGMFVNGFDDNFDAMLVQIDAAALELNQSLANDIETILSSSGIKRRYLEVTYDPTNNIIAFRSSTKALTSKHFKEQNFYHPIDRNSQTITNKYISTSTSIALSKYLQLCRAAEVKAEELMKHLCTLLYQDIITIIQSSHCAVIYQCAYEHTTSAIQRQWTLPKMLHDHQSRIFRVQGLFPYWMSASSCVKNDLDLRDIVFLTAPNMAGKSTLMRSVLVAALLGNCGLFVPCSIEATMPEYDAYFLRTSSFDAPIERKSSFAVEMSDLRVIMRDATQYSFVMLDEIGRGTSPVEGACLSGAILEWMNRKKCHGIFSTHIHDILNLPIDFSLRKLKMGMKFSDGQPIWTYRVEEGSIDDSLAFHTALRFGVSQELITRANEFKTYLTLKNTWPLPRLQKPSIETYSIEYIRDLVSQAVSQNLTLQEYLASKAVTVIPAGCLPPPALEQTSCVYILIFRERPHVPPSIYVGETESIVSRLRSHRHNQDFFDYFKTSTLDFDSLVIQVKNKSAARAIETFLITMFKQQNYDLCSDHDQSHTRFSLH